MALILIEKLGTRVDRKGWRRSWGKFLCFFCNKIFERVLNNWKTAKSCGCAHNQLVSESNKGKPSWNKGLKGIYSKETRQNISQKNKGKKRTEEQRKKMSEASKKSLHKEDCFCGACKMRKGLTKGKLNPMYGKVTEGVGRCKFYDYFSPVAGNVRLQGTYEIRFAKILDSLGWSWNKNKKYFPYCEDHSYIPDFQVLLENRIIYFETKGWFSEKDRLKIKQVREICNINLIVITKPLLEAYERMM